MAAIIKRRWLPLASFSPANILAKLLTVDGSGSGLDADTVDGSHASAFATLSGATFTGQVIAPKFLTQNFSLADDAVGTFALGGANGRAHVSVVHPSAIRSGLAYLRTDATHAAEKQSAGGGKFAATTGALTGTTGTNGNVTVSANSGTGLAYVENRGGGSAGIAVTVFGA